jgi:hypothetical protein
MKLILIFADLFCIAGLLIDGMEGWGMYRFNLPLTLGFILLAILNIHYLVGGKDKWTDNFLKKRFFKKGKLLKVILIPLVVFSLLTFLFLPGGQRFFTVILPSSANYIWYSNFNPDHYTDSWTGVLTQGTSCSVQDNLKTEVICERWGEMQKKQWADEEAIYKCYKNCPLKGKTWKEWGNACDFLNNTCNKQ